MAPAEYFHEGEPQKAGENQHQRGRGGRPDLPLVSETPGPGSKGFKIEGPEHEAEWELLADVNEDEDGCPCKRGPHQREMNRDEALERAPAQGARCAIIDERDKRLRLSCHLNGNGDVARGQAKTKPEEGGRE